MVEYGINQARSAVTCSDSAPADTLAAHLSHSDRQVRQKAVVALGNTGDPRAVEPLINTLSREVSRGASSFPVILDIIDAMAKIPDRRSLDVLAKLEGQLVDSNSPKCPAELPAGVITYIDTADGQLHRVFPKELHFKLFDVIRRMSARLMYRHEEIMARYGAYQDEVIQAELARTLPKLAEVLREEELATDAPEIHDDIIDGTTPLADNAMDGVDFDIVRRELEIEVSEYVRDNERLQDLIREGQRIKAHIQHARMEKQKYGSAALPERAKVR